MGIRWKVGDRVVRWANLDNGEWNRKGDACLPGPLRHGTVVRRYIRVESNHLNHLIDVKFDDGEVKAFLHHGLDAERKYTEGETRWG